MISYYEYIYIIYIFNIEKTLKKEVKLEEYIKSYKLEYKKKRLKKCPQI